MTMLSRHKFFAATLLVAGLAGMPLASAAGSSKSNTASYWRGGYFGPALSLYKLNNSYNPIAPLGVRKLKASGKLIGAIAGYNFLYKDFMLGIEGDISGASVFKNGLSYIGTLRGRIGKPYKQSLPFITGGVALAGLKKAPAGSPVRSSTIQPGFVVGAGFEHILANAITGRLEYTYGHFFSNSNSGGPSARLSNVHMFRASVAIHFRD